LPIYSLILFNIIDIFFVFLKSQTNPLKLTTKKIKLKNLSNTLQDIYYALSMHYLFLLRSGFEPKPCIHYTLSLSTELSL